MNLEVLVDVRSLTKKFRKVTALDKLNFSIYKGEIFGLLGPNGAGKSTFISVLTTLCKPTSGDIIVNNFSVSKQPDKIKKDIGFVPQDIALYPMLTGIDNLNFWAGIYGLRGQLKNERVQEALSIVRLEDRSKDNVNEYSGGMKRRLNIAVALLHHPGLLVMDEPTVGVDIQSRKYILDAVRALKNRGTTIIFTSHYTDEIESLCDRVAIMTEGVIRAKGTVKELLRSHGKEKLEEVMLDIIESDESGMVGSMKC